jgi:two-component system, LytTR family, response regulator
LSPPLRCLIAEDEPEARTNLVTYLQRADEVEVVAVVADGLAAVARIDELAPDLVFLDVRLPELDGVSVLRRIRSRPEVIFTTAYESYAVSAFELGALDYLVKPFGAERLLAALARVRERRGHRGQGAASPSAVERALATVAPPLARFFARKGQRIVPVAVADVIRVEAGGEYARVHTARDSFLLNVTLKDLIGQLDPQRFEQIHRSHIVNLDAVDHLRPADDRRLLVVLRDGTRIVASRGGSERLRRLLR